MNKIATRMEEAFSKAFFCARHTADGESLLRLLWQTKRWKRFMGTALSQPADSRPLAYKMQFAGQQTPLHLRTLRGDLEIFYEVFWKEVYPAELLHLPHCKTIIDLGGHVGMSALYFGLHAPAATVYVLEPDTENFAVLQQNIGLLNNRVIALHAAVAASGGTLNVQKKRYGYNTVAMAEEGGQPVFAITIKGLIEQYNLEIIDLLKIDIEGAEEDLLAGSTDWLSITNQIIIEVHSAAAFKVVVGALSAAGFSIKCLSGLFGEAGIYHAVNKR